MPYLRIRRSNLIFENTICNRLVARIINLYLKLLKAHYRRFRQIVLHALKKGRSSHTAAEFPIADVEGAARFPGVDQFLPDEIDGVALFNLPAVWGIENTDPRLNFLDFAALVDQERLPDGGCCGLAYGI